VKLLQNKCNTQGYISEDKKNARKIEKDLHAKDTKEECMDNVGRAKDQGTCDYKRSN